MRAFASSLVLATTFLLYLMAIPCSARGYKLVIDPVEFAEMEGLLSPRKWTKRSKFPAASYVGNQLEEHPDPSENFVDAFRPIPKSKHSLLLKYLQDAIQNHRTTRRHL